MIRKYILTVLFSSIVLCVAAQTRKEASEKFVNYLSNQKYKEAESLTDSAFQKHANEAILKNIWQQINLQLGTYNQIDSCKEYVNGAYILFLDFVKAKQKFVVSFNKEDKIIGFLNGGTTFKNQLVDTSIYTQQNLSIQANGGTIKGTLTLPEKISSKTPVALIIAGSGPTDRNGNSMFIVAKLNTYKLLADGLAKNGIASFRYDKRHVGESNNFASDISKNLIENEVYDADSIVQFLKTKFLRIYIIGHSEGSLIGILSSQKEKPAGFISIAGAGENIALTLKRQLSGMPDSTITDSIIAELQNRRLVKDVPNNLQFIFSPMLQPYIISWMKYDPKKEIKKLHCPILLLQGDKDWNITVNDAKNLKKAKPDAKLVIINGIDHELRNHNVPDMKKYVEQPLNNQLIEAIVTFINE